MLHIRSLLASTIGLAIAAAPAAAQGRIADEGTFTVTRPGAPSHSESFRIRVDNGTIIATGQLTAGTHRVSSALKTDTLGTPIEYTLDVRDNGAQSAALTALARGGRLTVRSQIARGDESTREYPLVPGSIILDDDLLHQTYFLALGKHGGTIAVIKPHTARSASVTVKALGLEPVTIAGHQVTATHYSAVDGSTTREFWIDAGGHLLQVEIAGTGIKASRDELPR